MSNDKLEIKLENMVLDLSGYMFRNEVTICRTKTGYAVYAYSRCGIVHLIQYYTDRKLKHDMKKEMVVQTSNGDQVMVYMIYTSDPEVVIRTLTEGIIPTLEYTRNFRNPEGFIRLRVKHNKRNYDARVYMINIKKDDEFTQGIMMILASCFRTDVLYSDQRYRRYHTMNTYVEINMNALALTEYLKMSAFMKNPVEDVVTEYEGSILAMLISALVPEQDYCTRRRTWYSDYWYQSLLNSAKYIRKHALNESATGAPYIDYDEFDF